MALTLAAARTALRRALADTAAPAAWSDADLDGALAAALAQLDALVPWPGRVALAAGGADRLPLPAGVRRVLAVLREGVPLAGWGVWAGELLLGEPVQGALEVRCFLARTLPSAPTDPLPLADASEEAFVLAAAREALLAAGLTHQARRQGPTGPLVAALAAARAERERAARALPRTVRTVPRHVTDP
ncbi:hypothetical protein OO015_04910 [Thermomicrobium sp. 4228-Ro]|uniref:hypothetical protein n=1 Tax=Thermomicrobium sp. 4228-Ro TaxID=2993937 RepID=UPI0022491B89|nr:hypothetical protein [Thermomicrobium sp. 4228-Ro]MCX2726834.1 hypothetical protein [Thermomicrobium sp. 4228-Ro]